MTQPWSVPVPIHDVPQTGRHFALTADEPTRTGIAALAGLAALPRLQAEFDVTPHGRDGLHVIGRVSATVGQTCVVTLEPMQNEVVEDINLIFAPPVAPLIVEEDGTEVEVTAVDAAEPLLGNSVDLGALATEFLILAIDPYPRRTDAVFEAPATPDEASHPFAALAALKKGGDGNNG
jgi:uncharacterized metal-binding protein YceD (DUF177 family)